jgi:hypothetical protein
MNRSFFDPAYDSPVLATPKELREQLIVAAVATGAESAVVLKRVGLN